MRILARVKTLVQFPPGRGNIIVHLQAFIVRLDLAAVFRGKISRQRRLFVDGEMKIAASTMRQCAITPARSLRNPLLLEKRGFYRTTTRGHREIERERERGGRFSPFLSLFFSRPLTLLPCRYLGFNC